jgi:hypothetical protein
MATRNGYRVALCLVALWLGSGKSLVYAQASLQPKEDQKVSTNQSRVLLVTVPENGNVTYSEHHTAPPVVPVNIVGQLLLNGAAAMNEKALNRLNAQQSPIIAKTLADYDFKSKIVAAANLMESNNAWLGIAQVSVNSDADPFIDNTFESLVHLACVYRFPLEFDALIVRCDFAVQAKEGAKTEGTADSGSSRLAARVFEVYVPLEDSYSASAYKNATRWSEHKGALARQALDIAIAKLPEVLDSGLATEPPPPGTSVQSKHIGHYSGAIANKDATGTLVTRIGVLWSYEFKRGVGKLSSS